MSFCQEYIEELKKNREAKLAKDSSVTAAVSAEKAEDKSKVVVVPTAAVKEKAGKFSKKTPDLKKAKGCSVKDATIKTNGKEVKVSGKNAKKRLNLKKKLVVGAIILTLAAGALGLKKNMEKYNTDRTNDDATIVEKVSNQVKENGGWEANVNSADTLYNQALAQGIEIYNKTGQQISGEDLVKMYIASNADYVSADFINELDMEDIVAGADITTALQRKTAINKEASDAGVVINEFMSAKQANDSAIESSLQANVKYATTGDLSVVKDELNKVEMATYTAVTPAGRVQIDVLAYGKGADYQKILLGETSAICKDEQGNLEMAKYDANLQNIRSVMDTKIANAQSKEDVNGKSFLVIANELDAALSMHAEKNPYTGKTMVELKNELLKNTLNKDVKEITKENSLEEAIKANPNIKVNESNKTYKDTSKPVIDNSKKGTGTTVNPNGNMKDANGKATTGENVKPGDKVTINNNNGNQTTKDNGNTYTKQEDGTYVQDNKNAGKGTVKEENNVTYKANENTSPSVNKEIEKEALKETKEKIEEYKKQTGHTNVEATVEFEPIDGPVR